MKKICIIILVTLISFSSLSQEYDFTFCLGRIKLVLNSDGSAVQTLQNSNGGIQSIVTGNYDKFEGAPAIVKINFKGTEYRYNLFQNSQGIPSMIIDAQGRQYSLCSYKAAKEKTLEQLDAEMRIFDANKKREEMVFKARSKEYFADIKKLNTLFNTKEKKDIPKIFDGLEAKYDYFDLTRYFTKPENDFYQAFVKKKDIVIAENIKNTGDKYGELTNWSLNNYFNTNGQKVDLPQNCRARISDRGEYYKKQPDLGYVIDGNIYNLKNDLIGKLEQDEKFYFIKNVKMSRLGGTNYNDKDNTSSIQIRTEKKVDYWDMDNRIESHIYNITKEQIQDGSYKKIWTTDSKESKGCTINAMITLYNLWNN
jgi:hypothetical protein